MYDICKFIGRFFLSRICWSSSKKVIEHSTTHIHYMYMSPSSRGIYMYIVHV